MKTKLYAERDPMALDEAGGYYSRHVMAMTSEDLRSKSDIAAELGYRDLRIDMLRQENAELPSTLTVGKTPEQQLAAHDLLERYLEDRLSRVRESRRELINRHNLNKDPQYQIQDPKLAVIQHDRERLDRCIKQDINHE